MPWGLQHPGKAYLDLLTCHIIAILEKYSERSQGINQGCRDDYLIIPKFVFALGVVLCNNVEMLLYRKVN